MASGSGQVPMAVTKTTQLNPNAKSFVPLNPLAEEFHPKRSCITPETKTVELRPAAERKPTPYIPKESQPTVEEVPEPSKGEQTDTEAEMSFDFDSPIAAYVSSDEDSEDDEEEEESDDEDRERSRQWSECSDDFVIDFEADSAKSCDKIVRNNPVASFVVKPDEEEEEEDSDSDASDCDEVDLSAQAEILSQFETPSFTPSLVQSKELNANVPEDQLHDRIVAANRTWAQHYASVASEIPEKKSSVCIAPSEANIIIYEKPEEAEDLKKSRQSDFMQRAADKERMERLLSKVFAPEHREKMYAKLYNEAAA